MTIPEKMTTAREAKKILLVEDDAITSLAEATAIRRFGYEVITAFTGEEAVQTASTDPGVSLVLMDINLGPGIDGTEAARQILIRRPLPIVFLTSHSEKEYVDRVKEITRYGYIIKNSGNFVLQSSIEMAYELFNAHEKVTESEQRYELIVASSGQVVYDYDEHTGEIVWGPSMKQVIGYTPEEYSGGIEQWKNWLHPDDREETLRLLDTALAEKSYWDTRYRLRHKDGHYVWVRDRGFFIPDKTGTGMRQVGTLENIMDLVLTEEEIHHKNSELEKVNHDLNEAIKKLEEANDKLSAISDIYMAANEELIDANRKLHQKEQALHASELTSQAMMSNINDVIGIIDASGTITYKSKNIEKLFGWKPDDLIGKHYTVTMHPDDRKTIMEKFMQITRHDNGTAVAEYRYLKKDGDFCVVHVTGVNLANDPNIRGVLVNYHDITEAKLAEEKIKKLLDEKELLIQEVHHRVKNNMNIIMGLLSLQSETLDNAPAVTALSDARGRIQSMMVLYDKLYRSDNVIELSVSEYLPGLVDEIISLYPRKDSITVQKDIADFALDVKRLSVIGIMVNELITNSLKHAFNGRKGGMITVSASLNGGTVSIAIGDDGPGIPESVDFEATGGFGLKLVGMLAKQLEGSISIDREHNRGVLLKFGL